MAKAFCVPALIVSFCAIILVSFRLGISLYDRCYALAEYPFVHLSAQLLLVTISLPTTLSDATPFDFVRGNNLGGIRDEGSFTNTNRELDSIRVSRRRRWYAWGANYRRPRHGTGPLHFDGPTTLMSFFLLPHLF